METINIRRKLKFNNINNNVKRKMLLTIVIILPILLISIFTLRLRPTFYKLCEIRSRTLANKTINEVIMRKMSNVDYENLIVFQKNSEDQISMIKLDSVMINTLSSQISLEIQEEFSKLRNANNTINIPLGSLVSNDIFSSMRTIYKSKNNTSGRYRNQF